MIKVKAKVKDKPMDEQVLAIDIPCFTSNSVLYHSIYCNLYWKTFNKSKNTFLEERKLQEELMSKGFDAKTASEMARQKINKSFQESKTVKDLKDIIYDEVEFEGEMVPKLLRVQNTIGPVRYNKIIKSVEFYDKYVEELMSKGYVTKNPFYYMKDEKLQVIRENELEILSKLDEEGYEFVFGFMGKTIDLAKEVNDSNRYTCKFDRLNMIENIIANYTTPDEINDITNPKVLSKFIIPHGNR